jgi:hypothetical protein
VKALPVLCLRDEVFVLQICEGSKVSKEHDVLQIGTFRTYMYTN